MPGERGGGRGFAPPPPSPACNFGDGTLKARFSRRLRPQSAWGLQMIANFMPPLPCVHYMSTACTHHRVHLRSKSQRSIKTLITGFLGWVLFQHGDCRGSCLPADNSTPSAIARLERQRGGRTLSNLLQSGTGVSGKAAWGTWQVLRRDPWQWFRGAQLCPKPVSSWVARVISALFAW